MLGWILKTGIIATTRYKKSIQLFWSIISLLIPFNHAIVLLAEAVLTGERIVVFYRWYTTEIQDVFHGIGFWYVQRKVLINNETND